MKRKDFVKTLLFLAIVILINRTISAQQEINAYGVTCSEAGGIAVCGDYQKCIGIIIKNTSDFVNEVCCKGKCNYLTKEEIKEKYLKAGYSEEEANSFAEEFYLSGEETKVKKENIILKIIIFSFLLVIFIFFIIFLLRRKHLKKVGVMIFTITFCSIILSSNAEAFRFVVISDTHTSKGISSSDLSNTIKKLDPEIILHAGDFSCCLPNTQFNFAEYKELKNYPIFPTTGNHEYDKQETISSYNKFWADKKPQNIAIEGEWAHSYSFDYKGYHFVFLDYKNQYANVQWLKKDLEKNKNKPTIIITHLPAIKTSPSCRDDVYNNNLQTIAKENNDIIAIFSGHQHCYIRNKIDENTEQIVVGTASSHELRGYPNKNIFVLVEAAENGKLKICPVEAATGKILEGDCNQNSGTSDLKMIWVSSPKYLKIRSATEITGQDLATLKTIVDSANNKGLKIAAATNGGFFGYTNLVRGSSTKSVGSTCLYIEEGKQHFPYENLDFCETRHVFYITNNDEFGIVSLQQFNRLFPSKTNIKYALQGVLLVDEGKVSSFNDKDPEYAYEKKHPKGKEKNGICIGKDGTIGLFVYLNDITLRNLADQLKNYCNYAIKIDGGGTSSMYIKEGQKYFKSFKDDESKNNICKGIKSFSDYKQNGYQGVGCLLSAVLVTEGGIKSLQGIGEEKFSSLVNENCQPGDVYGGGVLNEDLSRQDLVPIPEIEGEKICVNTNVCFSEPGDCCVLKEGAVRQIYPLYTLFKQRGCKLKIVSPFRSLKIYKEKWDASEKNPQTNCPPRDDAGKIMKEGYTEENFKHCPHYNGYAMDIWVECDPNDPSREHISYEEKIKIACQAGWVNYHHEGWHFEYGSNYWKRAKSKDKNLCQWPLQDSVLERERSGEGATTLYKTHNAITLDNDQQIILDPTNYIKEDYKKTEIKKIPKDAISLTTKQTNFGLMNIIEIDVNYFDVRTMSAKTIMDRTRKKCNNDCRLSISDIKWNQLNVVAAVNAAFFERGNQVKDTDEHPNYNEYEGMVSNYELYGRPQGIYIEDGKIISPFYYTKKKGYFVVQNGQPKILEVPNVEEAKKVLLRENSDIQYAVNGILKAGEDSGSRLTGVCITKENKLKLITTESGGNIQVFLDYLRDNENCQDALDLDGGGSTQMYYNYEGQNKVLKSSVDRKVANFIVVIPKAFAYGSPELCPPISVQNSPEEEILYGAYNVFPSFSVEVDKDFSEYRLLEDYSREYFEQCRNEKNILECFSEKSRSNEDFSFYFKKQGQTTNDNGWYTYCERKEEAFINDFVERYEDCRDSQTDSCYCEIPEIRNIPNLKIVVTEITPKDFLLVAPNIPYSLELYSGVFNTIFPKEIRTNGMIFNNYLEEKNYILRYYKEKKLSFEKDKANLPKCDISQNNIIKICAVSKKNKVFGINQMDGKLEETPLVYRFALETKDLPPPPVEDVKAEDLKRRKQLLLLSWDKSVAGDVVGYKIYESQRAFNNLDLEKAKSSPDINLVKNIDVGSAISVYKFVGVRCNLQNNVCDYVLAVKYSKDGDQSLMEIKQDQLIYEEETGKFYYVLSVEDDISYYYGVTAIDRKDQESTSFLKTPLGTSVNDIPPGLVSVTKQSLNEKSVKIKWDVPSFYIDGTQVEEKIKDKMSFEIYQKCPNSDMNVFSMSGKEIIQAPDCETKIIAKIGNIPSKEESIDEPIFKALGII
ncbi:MAG: phosphodiester glycosidase family protein [Candidatus Woesearchaeota archaeon]